MMKSLLSGFLSNVSLLVAPIGAATIGVSNLGQADQSTIILGHVLGQEYRFATSFTTGSGSFDLHSIILPFAGTYGGPASGYSLALYATVSASGPAGLVTSFFGNSTPSNSLESYTPSLSTTLLANTTYWIVEQANTTAPGTGFGTIHTGSAAEDTGGLSGWSIADHRWVTNNGGALWFQAGPNITPRQFSVQVAPVPDGGLTISLVAVSLTGLAALRRRS
jgi:hypothetical protein